MVSQTGLDPPQRPGSMAEHTPHPPLGWQAGAVPGQSALAEQPRQVCVPLSQMGWFPAPVQSELLMQAA